MSQGNRLSGKVAIVTGGSSGIGAETARQFARAGAVVVVCDVQADAGNDVVTQISQFPGTAYYRHLDVVDEEQWDALLAQVVKDHGKLDIVANIAGVSGRETRGDGAGAPVSVGVNISDQTLDSWNRIMAVNSTGTFLGTKHGAMAMAGGGGGSIINISSICGLLGSFSSAAYHASKGSVRLLSKAAAVQCAADKVRVNSIHPGFIETPMTQAAHANNATAKERLDATPLGRFGTPLDIAMGCVYLASDEAAFITGAELVIDGGVVAA
jgi:NAD(P)-dependent dehydrogenase (short-subunit alcohol dehydrogenase family)